MEFSKKKKLLFFAKQTLSLIHDRFCFVLLFSAFGAVFSLPPREQWIEPNSTLHIKGKRPLGETMTINFIDGRRSSWAELSRLCVFLWWKWNCGSLLLTPHESERKRWDDFEYFCIYFLCAPKPASEHVNFQKKYIKTLKKLLMNFSIDQKKAIFSLEYSMTVVAYDIIDNHRRIWISMW